MGMGTSAREGSKKLQYMFLGWGMKNRIAVIGNGWNFESISKAMKGIRSWAEREDFDIFVFLSFASYSEHTSLMQGELNVYKLCNPEEYDGIIVFSTFINSTETAVSVCRGAREKNVPVVSIGMELEGIDSVFVGNEMGMRDLMTHLIEVHGVKRVYFVGGTTDHVDSISRLAVTKKVLEEHGLALDEKDIGYGRWTNRHTADLINEVYSSEEGLPDAFVCANDVMALAACTELERLGVDVPGQVIVTGFDSIEEGRYFYPGLTSVAQNYELVGERACELIFDIIRDKAGTGKKAIVPASFVLGESCGCKGDLDFAGNRQKYCKHSFLSNTDAKLLEQNERVMRQSISDVQDYQQLKVSLQGHYSRNHQFEGDGFYIVLNSEYFENALDSERELCEKGFSERMEVVLALVNGQSVQDGLEDCSMLVPGYHKKEGEQHAYYFLPLHFYQYNYGYVVFQDEPAIMKENMLKSLYVKDPMTGLFNRFGYENFALPLYQESIQTKKSLMVMFVDINYMKQINDQFGHLHGDNAIRLVAEDIRENINKNWIAVRFGGDEFLIIAPDCDEAAASKVRRNILDYLEKKNHDGTRSYEISVSCGYVITDPSQGSEVSLQDYIREADRLMYEIKKELHARDGE